MLAGLMSRWTIRRAWAASSAFGDLRRDLDHLRDLQRPLPDQGIERPSFDELHGDERQPVIRLADVVHDADVRMVQRRRGLGLRQEPLPPPRIARHLSRQELDRRLAVEPRVFRQEHFPHPAGAELGGDAIVSDRLADHG